MDFAPYQSSPPEHGRTLSPGNDGVSSPRASWESASNRPRRISVASPPPLQHPQPQRAWSGDGIRSPVGGGVAGYQAPGGYQDTSPNIDAAHGGGAAGMVGDYFGALGAREGMVSEFDTSLGIRLDYEACLAYLAFPPLGPILLLVLERKSDYVRSVWLPARSAFARGSRRIANYRHQIPCVAIQPPVHGNIRHTPAILVVEVSQLGPLHRRYCIDRMVGDEGILGCRYAR